MSDNPDDKGGVSVNVELGKEIDRSLGSIIADLLGPSAKEIGSYGGDYFGQFADRMRIKRQANLQAALDSTRERLEADGVEMKDITPPEEEEIHLVLEGMSLSSDETVRELWAGFFAKALEPDSGGTIERPFVEVLKNLTVTDAKVIDFLAFCTRTNTELNEKMEKFSPVDFRNVTEEEKVRRDAAGKKNTELQKAAIASIRDKAKAYGVDELSGGDWSLNLLRLGLIDRNSGRTSPQLPGFRGREVDAHELTMMLDAVAKQLIQNEEQMAEPPDRVISKQSFGPQVPLEIQLSTFGERFAAACGLLPDG